MDPQEELLKVVGWDRRNQRNWKVRLSNLKKWVEDQGQKLPIGFERKYQVTRYCYPCAISNAAHDLLAEKLRRRLREAPEDRDLRFHERTMANGMHLDGMFWFNPYSWEGDFFGPVADSVRHSYPHIVDKVLFEGVTVIVARRNLAASNDLQNQRPAMAHQAYGPQPLRTSCQE